MNLSRLIEKVSILQADKHHSPDIHHVRTDSRLVQPGDLFIAISGIHQDGHAFIPHALEKGAVAVITEKAPSYDIQVPVIQVESTREAFSLIMQAWYHYPSNHIQLAAITGSNGKTTTAYMLYSILQQVYGKSGLIGTAGYYNGCKRLEQPITGPATTPDPDQIQMMLHSFLENGCKYAVMEASSFGIDQKRVFGMLFDVILWTNFSPNHHVRYHGDISQYFNAKKNLLNQIKPGGLIVLNHDMDHFETCKKLAPLSQSVGFHKEADLRILSVQNSIEKGLEISFCYLGNTYHIRSPLVGEFHAYNLAQVFLVSRYFGIETELLLKTIPLIDRIPGRWEMIMVEKIPFTVLIDKANTVISLEALFKNLSTKHYNHKMVVYGQVGGGSPDERKKIGSFMNREFDSIYLTVDDPENEDPVIGINHFFEGIPASDHKKVIVELSRAKAMQSAFQNAQANDLVAILGRGNQKEFLIQGRTEVFDDTVESRNILRSMGMIP